LPGPTLTSINGGVIVKDKADWANAKETGNKKPAIKAKKRENFEI
jgi:hypothetical protein